MTLGVYVVLAKAGAWIHGWNADRCQNRNRRCSSRGRRSDIMWNRHTDSASPPLGGRFLMGSPLTEPERYEHEGPVHEGTLSPFWLGRFPVTNEQFGR